jgi:hypothetical protein
MSVDGSSPHIATLFLKKYLKFRAHKYLEHSFPLHPQRQRESWVIYPRAKTWNRRPKYSWRGDLDFAPPTLSSPTNYPRPRQPHRPHLNLTASTQYLAHPPLQHSNPFSHRRIARNLPSSNKFDSFFNFSTAFEIQRSPWPSERRYVIIQSRDAIHTLCAYANTLTVV